MVEHHITQGSVFDDLGFTPKKAENLEGVREALIWKDNDG